MRWRSSSAAEAIPGEVTQDDPDWFSKIMFSAEGRAFLRFAEAQQGNRACDLEITFENQSSIVAALDRGHERQSIPCGEEADQG